MHGYMALNLCYCLYSLHAGKKPRKHYVPAESYVVRWWPSQDESPDERSESTTGRVGNYQFYHYCEILELLQKGHKYVT